MKEILDAMVAAWRTDTTLAAAVAKITTDAVETPLIFVGGPEDLPQPGFPCLCVDWSRRPSPNEYAGDLIRCGVRLSAYATDDLIAAAIIDRIISAWTIPVNKPAGIESAAWLITDFSEGGGPGPLSTTLTSGSRKVHYVAHDFALRARKRT